MKNQIAFSHNSVFTMTSPQHKRKEDDAKSLTERVNELQQEVEYLQGELVNAAERIDQLQRKNDERKTKAHATIRSLKYVLCSIELEKCGRKQRGERK